MQTTTTHRCLKDAIFLWYHACISRWNIRCVRYHFEERDIPSLAICVADTSGTCHVLTTSADVATFPCAMPHHADLQDVDVHPALYELLLRTILATHEYIHTTTGIYLCTKIACRKIKQALHFVDSLQTFRVPEGTPFDELKKEIERRFDAQEE